MMLAKKEYGVKGLSALFDFYQTYFGADATGLAQEQGYTLCIENILCAEGELDYDGKRIIVSQEAHPLHRDFTIFHEIAHHSLFPVAPPFADGELQNGEYDDIEHWCDNFGVAMFFAQRGARLMEKENYESFLTHDNAAAYNGKDFVYPWRQSLVLSKQVSRLARQFFRPKDVAYMECKVLEYSFLLASKVLRLREEMPIE